MNDSSDSNGSGRDRSVQVLPDGGTTLETNINFRAKIAQNGFVQSVPFWGWGVLLVAIFIYGTIGWNVLISLTDWAGLGQPSYDELSLEMYSQMLQDPSFLTAFKNTVVLLITFTIFTLLIGLIVAIFVDRKIRFESAFRTIYLLPMSLAFTVTALFWTWIYNPTSGLLNEALRTIGLGFLTHNWIGDPKYKMAAVIFALIWQFSGFAMIIYLAGLRTIPTTQYEAARIDGATSVRMYYKVIIPQLRASTVSAAIVLVSFSLKAFDFLFVMFGNNPGPSVDILSTMMFREAFAAGNWAYGSAVAVVLFVLALVIITPFLYMQYQWGEL